MSDLTELLSDDRLKELLARVSPPADGWSAGLPTMDIASIVTELLDRRKDGLGTVSVNTLQWIFGQRTAEATVPFGEYQVAEYTETDGMGYVATFNDALELGEFARADEAMAACQSDFETRVKSCLTSIGVEAGK